MLYYIYLSLGESKKKDETAFVLNIFPTQKGKCKHKREKNEQQEITTFVYPLETCPNAVSNRRENKEIIRDETDKHPLEENGENHVSERLFVAA